jgi:hypothetical protein
MMISHLSINSSVGGDPTAEMMNNNLSLIGGVSTPAILQS